MTKITVRGSESKCHSLWWGLFAFWLEFCLAKRFDDSRKTPSGKDPKFVKSQVRAVPLESERTSSVKVGSDAAPHAACHFTRFQGEDLRRLGT